MPICPEVDSNQRLSGCESNALAEAAVEMEVLLEVSKTALLFNQTQRSLSEVKL